jgi:hypothetical protein
MPQFAAAIFFVRAVVSYDEAHAVTLVCVIMERMVEIDKDLLLSSKY